MNKSFRTLGVLGVVLGTSSSAWAWGCKSCCCCPPAPPMMPYYQPYAPLTFAPATTGFPAVAPVANAGFSMNMGMSGDPSLAMVALPLLGRFLGLLSGTTPPTNAASAVGDLTKVLQNIQKTLDDMNTKMPKSPNPPPAMTSLTPAVERSNAEVKRMLTQIATSQKASTAAPRTVGTGSDEQVKQMLADVAATQKAPKTVPPTAKVNSETEVKRLLSEITALQDNRKAPAGTPVVNSGK